MVKKNPRITMAIVLSITAVVMSLGAGTCLFSSFVFDRLEDKSADTLYTFEASLPGEDHTRHVVFARKDVSAYYEGDEPCAVVAGHAFQLYGIRYADFNNWMLGYNVDKIKKAKKG